MNGNVRESRVNRTKCANAIPRNKCLKIAIKTSYRQRWYYQKSLLEKLVKIC